MKWLDNNGNNPQSSPKSQMKIWLFCWLFIYMGDNLVINEIIYGVMSISPIIYDVESQKWENIYINQLDNTEVNIAELLEIQKEIILNKNKHTIKVVLDNCEITGTDFVIKPKYCQLLPSMPDNHQ